MAAQRIDQLTKQQLNEHLDVLTPQLADVEEAIATLRDAREPVPVELLAEKASIIAIIASPSIKVETCSMFVFRSDCNDESEFTDLNSQIRPQCAHGIGAYAALIACCCSNT